jgi:YcaO-like protein with predicted kinase domain
MSIKFFDGILSDKKIFLEGTHRTCSPTETLQKFLPKKSKMGITRLSNITGLDFIGLPVYVAVRPNSRSLSNSQGKGFDDASAMASAFMEAAESWHAENLDLSIIFDSPAGIRLKHVTAPLAPLLRNKGQCIEDHVPFMWVLGYDMIANLPIYVPYETISLYFLDEIVTKRTFHQTSSGLASGNTLLESVNHGTYELIERHSIEEYKNLTLREREARRLNLTSVTDERCLHVINLLKNSEVEVAVFDATGAIGVPTYECRIFDKWDTPRWSLRGIYAGYGTHLCPGVALMRAMTEAIQSRLTKIAGARDDIFMEVYESKIDSKILKVLSEKYKNTPATRLFPESTEHTSHFDRDLDILINRLK